MVPRPSFLVGSAGRPPVSRILLLGSRGRLGAALVRKWSGTHTVSAFSRQDIDVTDRAALLSLLERSDYDVLVNATGLTQVDRCESARDEARDVNDRAPGILARAAAARGARLMHFSTDYVFDGRKTRPYVEEDPALPLGHYGATKLAGERKVLAASPDHLVVRVSWIFGPDKPGFVESVIAQAAASPHVEAIADKVSCPAFSEDIADWLEPFLTGLGGGLYHACNAGACTWQEYGRHALACAAQSGVTLQTTDVRGIRLAEMTSFSAPRPVQTAMSTEKLASAIATAPRPWQDALAEYLAKKFTHAPILSPAP